MKNPKQTSKKQIKIQFMCFRDLKKFVFQIDPLENSTNFYKLDKEIQIQYDTKALEISDKNVIVCGGYINFGNTDYLVLRSDNCSVIDSKTWKLVSKIRLDFKLSNCGLLKSGKQLFVVGGEKDFCESNKDSALIDLKGWANQKKIITRYFGNFMKKGGYLVCFRYQNRIWGIDRRFGFGYIKFPNLNENFEQNKSLFSEEFSFSKSANEFKGMSTYLTKSESVKDSSWNEAFARILDHSVPKLLVPIPRQNSFLIMTDHILYLFDMRTQEILFLFESSDRLLCAKFIGCMTNIKDPSEKIKNFPPSKERFRIIDNNCDFNLIVIVDSKFIVTYYDLNRQRVITKLKSVKSSSFFKPDKDLFYVQQNGGEPGNEDFFDKIIYNASLGSDLCYISESVDLDDPGYLNSADCDKCSKKTDFLEYNPKPNLKENNILFRHLGTKTRPCLLTIYDDLTIKTEPILLCEEHHKFLGQSTNIQVNKSQIILLNMGFICLFDIKTRRVIDTFQRTMYYSTGILPNLAIVEVKII